MQDPPLGVGCVVGGNAVVIGMSPSRDAAHVFLPNGDEAVLPDGPALRASLSPPPRGAAHTLYGADDPESAASFLQGAQYVAALREDYPLAQKCKESITRLHSGMLQHAPRLQLCSPLPSGIFERQLVTGRESRRNVTSELRAPPTDMLCATQIHAVWDSIRTAVSEAYPKVPHMAEAAAVLRMYRRLCKASPHTTRLSEDLTLRAQLGATLLATQGTLKKTPEKPTGWSDEGYTRALQGTNGSLAVRWAGGEPVPLSAGIHAMVNGSGAASGAELAHRRWLLCPGLAETGFGSCGETHTVYTYAAQQSYHDMPDFVAFPPAGCFPVEWMDEDVVWSCQLNPLRYALGPRVTVTISPLTRGESGPWVRLSPLPAQDLHIPKENHGVGPCVAFRPTGLYLADGCCYEVCVSGLLALPAEDPSNGGVEVEETVLPSGEVRLTVRNTSRATKYILKYSFEGTEKVPPRVVPLSPSVVVLPEAHQFRVALAPGEALPFVRGVWFSYGCVHASGPPDSPPEGCGQASVRYTAMFCSAGLPGTGVDSRDIQ